MPQRSHARDRVLRRRFFRRGKILRRLLSVFFGLCAPVFPRNVRFFPPIVDYVTDGKDCDGP